MIPTTPPELIDLAEGYAHTIRPGFMTRGNWPIAMRSALDATSALSNIIWPWAQWKTATVVQQIYVRFVRGQTTDPRFESMGKQPPVLARAAARGRCETGVPGIGPGKLSPIALKQVSGLPRETLLLAKR